MRRPHQPNPPHSPRTEAERTSHTRFGPRPVPTGQRPAHAGRPAEEAGTTAKVIVWTGVALGVAGVTAAAAILGRKLAGTDTDGDHRPHGPAVAPRFAALDEEEREAMRRRVRAQDREDRERAARLRAGASRGRRGNMAKDLTRTATDLSRGLSGVAESLTGAFTAFRGVSSQATSIVGDFVAAADQLRAILNGAPGPQPVQPHDRGARPHRDGPQA